MSNRQRRRRLSLTVIRPNNQLHFLVCLSQIDLLQLCQSVLLELDSKSLFENMRFSCCPAPVFALYFKLGFAQECR